MRNYNFKLKEERKRFYCCKEWRTLREIKLNQNPLCERCEKKDKLIPAVDIHHKIDLVDDGSKCLDLDNLESLCKECHTEHTNKEYNKKKKEVKDKLYNQKWNF